MEFPVFRPQKFEGVCYRNIATIKTSQDLFDDLVGNASDLPTIQHWADALSGIDHSTDPKMRPFQYGDATLALSVFDDDKWYAARFSDGKSFGVWYGALEKHTSIREALFWQYTNVYKPMMKDTQNPVVVDRRMMEASVVSDSMMDLRPIVQEFPAITSPTDYSFCQALGAKAVSQGIALFLTPSVRCEGGTCAPIFEPASIVNTKTLFYLHFEFRLDGTVRITTDNDEIVNIPEEWVRE